MRQRRRGDGDRPPASSAAASSAAADALATGVDEAVQLAQAQLPEEPPLAPPDVALGGAQCGGGERGPLSPSPRLRCGVGGLGGPRLAAGVPPEAEGEGCSGGGGGGPGLARAGPRPEDARPRQLLLLLPAPSTPFISLTLLLLKLPLPPLVLLPA